MYSSFAAEQDFGRSRLNNAVTDSDSVVVARTEDIAVMLDALPVLAESGRFAVGDIAPNMGAVEASGRGLEGKRGGESERGRNIRLECSCNITQQLCLYGPHWDRYTCPVQTTSATSE